MTTTMNGRARKSLADQIDRLDQLLDGLAEGLADAVAEAVRQAVTAAMIEVLANPEFRVRLQATPSAATVEPAPRPCAASGPAQRLRSLLLAARVGFAHLQGALVQQVGRLGAAIQDRWAMLGRVARRTSQTMVAGMRLAGGLFQPTTQAFLAGVAVGCLVGYGAPLASLVLRVLRATGHG